MPLPVIMSLHSEGIKPQVMSKDLVLGTDGLNVSIHRQNRNCKDSDEEADKRKSKYINEFTGSRTKLLDRHSSEEKELQIKWRERKDALEKKHRLESAVVHSINRSEEVRVGKLKILEAKHRQTLAELESEMSDLHSDMKARHCAEREAKEKEGVCMRTEDGLLDNLHSELAETVLAKSASLPGNNNLEGENINKLGSVDLHVPLLQPHKDPAEKYGRAEHQVVAIPVDKDRSADRVNDEANQVMQTVTSKDVLLSAENPTLQTEADANEESTPPAREEQHDPTLQKSTHIQPMISPSVVQPVLNIHPQVNNVSVSQEHATSHERLNPLINEDVCAETSRNILPSSDHSDYIQSHLPPQQPVPAISHPVDSIRQCSVSSGVLVNLPSTIPYTTTEVPNQEDHRRPNSSLPASPQFDPLHREYERMRGESDQLSRNHEEMVLQLKSERDKEMEELVGGIRRKYESMLKESEAASVQKKRELEHWKFKLMMNMKLAEAIRSKYLDITTAPSQQVASRAFPQNVNQSLRPRSQQQIHVARTNSLQEQASAGPAAEGLLTVDGVICLSDDE